MSICKTSLTFDVKQTILFVVKLILHFTLGGDDLKNNIAELRKQRQITQEELANAVGVSRQTIISLEGGRYTASLPLAFRLSAYFGRPIEAIFAYEEDEK